MRDYLDWNATTPLRGEAIAAMREAMEISGNPSSVHTEGRAAKMALEKAREQVAAALGAEGADVVFTSGATEAAAMVLAGQGIACAAVEHEAVLAWCEASLPVDADGKVQVATPHASAVQLANSETGVIQDLPEGLAVCDATQGVGKIPVGFGKLPIAFNWLGCDMALVSAHKLGGPKGIGALVMKRGIDLAARIRGGGQEMGRRSGTENVIGIAGFGAAAEAAARDLSDGVWERIAALRDKMEAAIAAEASDITFAGKGAARLPNTSCIVSPGWKGETQVMQMDLNGFAISAGSACSSGKVRASKVLAAMGFDEGAAASAIRVSLGPLTTEDDVMRFAERWCAQSRKHRARAA